jgi:hypothetical protein
LSSPKLLFTDLSAAVITAGTTDPDFPTVNLQTYLKRDVWKGGELVAGPSFNASLAFDFGSAKNRDTVIIENHNLASFAGAGTPKLQAADDSGFSSGLVDVVPDLSSAADPYYHEFTAVNKRYWRIFYSGTPPSVEEMQIGQIFIDRRWEVGQDYDYPYAVANGEFASSMTTALDGTIRTAQPYGRRDVLELTFSLLSNNDAAFFRLLMATIRGRLRPFYFTDVDGTLYYCHLWSDYQPVWARVYGRSDIKTIVLKTQLTTDEPPSLSAGFILDIDQLDLGVLT